VSLPTQNRERPTQFQCNDQPGGRNHPAPGKSRGFTYKNTCKSQWVHSKAGEPGCKKGRPRAAPSGPVAGIRGQAIARSDSPKRCHPMISGTTTLIHNPAIPNKPSFKSRTGLAFPECAGTPLPRQILSAPPPFQISNTLSASN